MAKNLVLEDIVKIYGKLYAVKNMNLEIKEGEFLTLLGPSGCGKTTTLRMVAGFEEPDSGKLIYNGKVIDDLIPQRRNFGIVFQSYALFPHMKVRENVAFGLKMHKYPKNRIEGRVDELLNIVGLIEHKEKYPPRALRWHAAAGGPGQGPGAHSPEVLLLDEPLSALDAKSRVKLRGEIKQLQSDLGITTIYVTHDQEEALSISDRVVVMKQGLIEQVDIPINIYKKPVSQYVADFVGTSNFFEGKLKDGFIDGKSFKIKVKESEKISSGAVTGAIRPEKIEVVMGHAAKKMVKENLLQGKLLVVVFLGLMVRLVVKVGEMDIIVDFLEKQFEDMGINRGDIIDLYFPPDGFTVYRNE